MRFFVRIIFLMCMVFFSAYAASGQIANFTADYTAGCAPLVVHFTNTSTGATSYSWNLGNGATPIIANPSTSYTTPGTYTVTLTAYSGGSSSTHTITITVYPVPTVNFYANDTSVCPGTPVTFTSNSLGGVAGPLTYTWNFGDGYAGSSATPSHPYLSPGTYNVTLSVINAQGCISSLTKSVYMHVFTPAVVNFTASPNYFCTAPGVAVFNNLTTGTPGITYYWSFGDGGSSTSASPTHSYTAAGTYTVKLIATDGNGCTDTFTRPSYIGVGNLTAGFSFISPSCVNSSVTFINTSNAHTSSSWSFGDGGRDTANNPTHAYSAPGIYTVTLIVSDGYCYDTIVHTITISPGPATSFIISPGASCPAPTTLTFIGTAPAGSSVTWLYGGGATGSGATASHTYANDGIDTISMVTVSAGGCRDTITQVDTIHNLISSIGAVPSSGCVPLTVPFSLTLITTQPNPTPQPYPYGVASYSWNFGDGSAPSSASAPSHTYTAVGVYTAILTGVTGNGCPFSDTMKIYVGTPPTVTFTAVPTHVCAGVPVIFTASHTGTVTDYIWAFGDGDSQIDSTNTASQYGMPGSPNKVTAYYNGCPSIPYVINNYITVDSPSSLFSFGYSCLPPTQVTFTNNSLGADSFLWLFGDGTTSTVWDPTHNYSSLSNYTVKLTTYNAASGCHDTGNGQHQPYTAYT